MGCRGKGLEVQGQTWLRKSLRIALPTEKRWPLIPALGRQRQVDVYELETSLVHTTSSWTVRDMERDYLKTSNKQNNINELSGAGK